MNIPKDALQRRVDASVQRTNPYGFRGKNARLNKLAGIRDPRGRLGILSRGKNVYNGSSGAAHHSSGYNMGRPSNASLRRRIKQVKGA